MFHKKEGSPIARMRGKQILSSWPLKGNMEREGGQSLSCVRGGGDGNERFAGGAIAGDPNRTAAAATAAVRSRYARPLSPPLTYP